MSDLPEPLVAADVDLRDFGFMPLDVRRLLTSETWIEAADAPKVGHAVMCLWCESWHQVPAASLPDNNKVLARLAMCEPKVWTRIRGAVLKGWVKCSDGLLYHPVVAEKARESWEAKVKQRERTKAATEAREARRRADQRARDEARNEERDVQRNDGRNDARDGPRNDQRDVERDVHQGTGTVKGQGQGLELQPLTPPTGGDVPVGTRGSGPPDCPHERIIELYHELMPLNPRVLEWNDTRRGHLRARWREKALPNGKSAGYATTEAGLVYWRRFFAWCSESKFLTGQAEPTPGKPPFCPNLDWLLHPQNFAKVLEGNYHR